MERDRAAFELARLDLQERAQVATQTLMARLQNPLQSWGEDAVWQLSMCEFAWEQVEDTTSSAKQLQIAFRDACEEARHPSQVPRLRGSQNIDELAVAFFQSVLLREELHRQLQTFKRHYCSLFSGFGRSRSVSPIEVRRVAAVFDEAHA